MCLLYSGFDSLASINVWESWSAKIATLGILEHYTAMSRGLIGLIDVAYFIGLIAVVLMVTKLILGVKK